MSSGSYVRSPIVCVLGHVDVGKTLLLDKIRGTATMFREVGAMAWRGLAPLGGTPST